jgi:23S rRNA (uracil1939-C5)-methyltransferase
MNDLQPATTSTTTAMATVTALSHEGRGIAHIEGKTTFIEGALPGETVEFLYTKRRRQYDEAQMVKVLTSSSEVEAIKARMVTVSPNPGVLNERAVEQLPEEVQPVKPLGPSPQRVSPRCRHYAICGGCTVQHMSPEAQIAHKQQALLDLLARVGKVIPAEILPPLLGPVWGYRTKARLGVKYVIKKEKLLVGFRERDPRFLADISHCEVLHPAVGQNLEALKTLIASLSCYMQIPQVEVAISEDIIALIFRHMEDLPVADRDKLSEFGKAQNWHIYAQPKGPTTIHRLWPTSGPELLSYHLPAYNVHMQFHPIDFTQVNQTINEQMVAQALELLQLQPTDTALDLFCGIGNFTLPMARFCREVVGIEGAATSIARAKANAALNDIDNVDFYVADLTKNTSHFPWIHHRYDKVLLDPPRTGAFDILPGVLKWQPTRIVYVSCNPATLARDAAKLQELGYTCQSAGVMDMFPQTSHVEAMVLFVKETP